MIGAVAYAEVPSKCQSEKITRSPNYQITRFNTAEARVRAGFSRVLTLLIVAGALVVLGFWLFSGERRSEEKQVEMPTSMSAARLGGDVRAMTVNVRMASPNDGMNIWQNRREFLVKTLLKYGPDLIGCQEVTPAQGAYLVKELGKWYDYYPRAGVGKEGEGSERGSLAETEGSKNLTETVTLTFASLNTLFFRADRFEIVDGEAGLVLPGELQRNPTENTFYTLAVLRERQPISSSPTDMTESSHRQIQTDTDKRQEWIVVNTHLRHDEAFAEKCAAGIREKIAAARTKYPGAQVVLMGDMNHNMNSKVYARLVGKTAADGGDGAGVLSDCFDYTQRRPKEAWGNWHAFTGVSRTALPSDLIFTSSDLKSKPAELIRDKDANGRYPSDHFFVMTEIELLPRP